jgi:GH15 family glucan-1,4-alpha-glucosidase
MVQEAAASTGTLSSKPAAPAWLSLHDYGLIGNQQTAALVSRHGSVEWACFPRFDSPSVFAQLLDRTDGGAYRVAPVGPYVSHQQYAGGTNILTTFFELRRGVRLTLTDFMPIGPAAVTPEIDPRIVRCLAARGEAIEVAIDADPRFDYGRERPTWTIDGDRATASGASGQLHVTSPWPWERADVGVRSRGTVTPGSPVFTQTRWGAPPPPEPRPGTLLAHCDAYWRAWVSPPDAPLRRVAARWHPWVERSELVLKLLSPAGSGVFVAAPTTSLPEWPGGTRNWDYRFVWIRDAAFTAQVFLLLGHVAEAREYVRWAFARADPNPQGDGLRTVYAVDGTSPPAEEELGHLEGHLGSRPVRVGNAAADQLQLDVYGELLDSALLLEQVDPAFIRERWPTIEQLAERTTQLWAKPDSGIWEFRTEPAHYVHSKLMCWVALDRAVQIAQAFGQTERIDQWKRVADEIRAAVLSRGYNDRLGAFVQAFDRPVVDASTLRIPIVGFLPPNDPRVLGTMATVEKTLDQNGFLKRYDGDDGIAGPEGAFLLCSFWLVESLAKCGQIDRALERWRMLLDSAGPLLLFSEEYDPLGRRPLGNYPQAFTHIGVLRAALALGLVGSDQ